MLEYRTRKAKKTDMDEIIQLCQEHAAFEENDYSSEHKAKNLEKLLFSEPPQIECIVVETNHGLVGYATYMLQLSTWDASHYMYVDCLFLRPETRRQGIGKELMQLIVLKANEQNCLGVQWQTPVFNTSAIAFYNGLGAHSRDKMRFSLDRSSMQSITTSESSLTQNR